MRAFIIWATSTILLASPAVASDWKRVPWNPNSGVSVNEIDVDLDGLKTTLGNQYHGVFKTFWMRRLRYDGGQDKGHVTIDCDNRSYVVDSGQQYDKTGKVLSSFSGDYHSAPIPPDTDFDALRLFVCQ
jgi:hypothetical protein